jgi:plastocyanin
MTLGGWMSGKRYLVMLAAVFTLALVSTACGSKDDNSGGDSGAAADMTMTVKDFEFDPSTVDVSSGETTIEITNTGAVEHSFTLDDDSVSHDIEPGETETVTVNVTADAGFHCKYHPDQMTGTLKVG